jgi:hypothetical protein
MRKTRTQRALDSGFAQINFTAQHRDRVFAALKGEEPVKRKLSLILVIIILLSLAVITALAVTLFGTVGDSGGGTRTRPVWR